MSVDEFKKAYDDADITQLRKYITRPKLISTDKFINYVETSFTTNIKVCDVLILILLNQYDLNSVTINLIDRDNIDLMEYIFSYDTELVLDHEKLIPLTVPKGRISMAKLIYEYNHGNEDSYYIVKDLLDEYNFAYNKNEKSIDSFVLGLHNIIKTVFRFLGKKGEYKIKQYTNDVNDTISYINPAFWNNFAIKYATETCNHSVVKKLLLCPEVDPGVDNNYALTMTIYAQDYIMADKLLKHPLVIPHNSSCPISLSYIIDLIDNNCLCVSEKLLRIDDEYIVIFKSGPVINRLIEIHNDITYLAIKLGILDVSELINRHPNKKRMIKKYLREFEIDDVYVCPSYDLNLDPIDILKNAIKSDDIDLAKTIKNYPISIHEFNLVDILRKYENENENSVINYIYNVVLMTYNPNLILTDASSTPNIFKKIFNAVIDNPELYCKFLYHDIEFHVDSKPIILDYIRKNYDKEYYEKFLKN